jgi:UDP-N-acetylmuramoyl-tripeptide--D-alanyl-D-alanine ligase
LNLYYTILNALLFVSAFVLLKHSWYRFTYFLQMFQQHGYKIREFYHWFIRGFQSRVVIPEHFLFIIVIFSILLFLSESLTISAATLTLSLFTLFWFGSVTRFKAEKDKKPLVYTARMKRLAFTLGTFLFLFIFTIIDLSFTGRLMNTPIVIRGTGNALLAAEPYFLLFGLVLADMSVPFFLFLAAWLMAPLERSIHNSFKNKARKKLSGMPDLKIIAITGSYGKTSTKFLIHALLKERYQVCMTPGSYNTPMGICKVINNDLEARHQILILEMGARYEGNIKELCEIARPDVSVITNVGIAHLETFGSEENIAREKSTLAKELKPGGILVLNGDDEAVSAMGSLNKEAKILYAGIHNGSVRASGIEYNEKGTRFAMQWLENGRITEEHEIGLRLLGAHNVQNFLLAACVAREFGIRPGTMALAAAQIEPVEHRLELKQQNGLTIIDDAFNSNPTGAKNAVEILSSFPAGRKVIITPGMIELGDIQEEVNRMFGKHIAEANLDLVILVGRQQTEPILQGFREHGGPQEKVRVANSLFEANEIARQFVRDGDVILYENDLPDTYSEG